MPHEPHIASRIEAIVLEIIASGDGTTIAIGDYGEPKLIYQACRQVSMKLDVPLTYGGVGDGANFAINPVAGAGLVIMSVELSCVGMYTHILSTFFIPDGITSILSEYSTDGGEHWQTGDEVPVTPGVNEYAIETLMGADIDLVTRVVDAGDPETVSNEYGVTVYSCVTEFFVDSIDQECGNGETKTVTLNTFVPVSSGITRVRIQYSPDNVTWDYTTEDVLDVDGVGNAFEFSADIQQDLDVYLRVIDNDNADNSTEGFFVTLTACGSDTSVTLDSLNTAGGESITISLTNAYFYDGAGSFMLQQSDNNSDWVNLFEVSYANDQPMSVSDVVIDVPLYTFVDGRYYRVAARDVDGNLVYSNSRLADVSETSVTLSDITQDPGSGQVDFTIVNAYEVNSGQQDISILSSTNGADFVDDTLVPAILLGPQPRSGSFAAPSDVTYAEGKYYQIAVRDVGGVLVYSNVLRFTNGTIVTLNSISNDGTIDVDFTNAYENAYSSSAAMRQYSDDGNVFIDGIQLTMPGSPYTGSQTYPPLGAVVGKWYRVYALDAFDEKVYSGALQYQIITTVTITDIINDQDQIAFTLSMVEAYGVPTGEVFRVNIEYSDNADSPTPNWSLFRFLDLADQPTTNEFGIEFSEPPIDGRWYRVVVKDINDDDVISNEFQYIPESSLELTLQDNGQVTYVADHVYADVDFQNPQVTNYLTLQHSADGDTWDEGRGLLIIPNASDPSTPYTGTQNMTTILGGYIFGGMYHRLRGRSVPAGGLNQYYIYSNIEFYESLSSVVLNSIAPAEGGVNGAITLDADYVEAYETWHQTTDGYSNNWQGANIYSLSASPFTGNEVSGMTPFFNDTYQVRLLVKDANGNFVISNEILIGTSAEILSIVQNGGNADFGLSLMTAYETNTGNGIPYIALMYESPDTNNWSLTEPGSYVDLPNNPHPNTSVLTASGYITLKDGWYYRINVRRLNATDVYSEPVRYIMTSITINTINEAGDANITFVNMYPDGFGGPSTTNVERSYNGTDWSSLGWISCGDTPMNSTLDLPGAFAGEAGRWLRIHGLDSYANGVYSNEYFYDFPSTLVLDSAVLTLANEVDYAFTTSNLYSNTEGFNDVRVQYSTDNTSWTYRTNFGVLGASPATGSFSFTDSDGPNYAAVGRWVRLVAKDYYGNQVASNSVQLV